MGVGHALRCGAGIVAGLVLGGCRESPDPIPDYVEEEDFVQFLAFETCSDAFDCDCPERRWDSRGECMDEQRMRRRDETFVAEANALRYDGACVVELILRARALDCEVSLTEDATDEQREAADCPIPCKAYFGDVQAGEPCRMLGVTVPVDDCAQGLRCEDRVCVPMCPAPPLSLGDRCRSGIVELGRCASDAFCDEASGTCVVAPLLDAPCQSTCAPEAWCDRSLDPPICVPTHDAGTSCLLDASCRSGLCEEQVCTPPAALVCP